MINDYELEKTIAEVEKIRKQVTENEATMEIYKHLKQLNKEDQLYGWMFIHDDILEDDLVEFAKSYQKPYVLEVLQIYKNELENIILRSDL